jgi:hypothetical protein
MVDAGEAAFWLDPARYPVLSAAAHGAHGEPMREELRKLLAALCPPRAPRIPTRVIAKLVRNYAGTEVEESIVVRDISESGMRITLPVHLQISLFEITSPTFSLRVGAGRELRTLRVGAVLARVAAVDQHGANLAYRFEALSDSDRAAIHALRNWTAGEGSTEQPISGPSKAR